MSRNKPKCIGIIMDGNRRFAKAKGVSVPEGHKAGFETFKSAIEWAKELGIEHLIAYCFSTENWKRNKLEIVALMHLLRVGFKEIKEKYSNSKEVKFNVIGNIKAFPKDIQKMIEETNSSKQKTSLTIHLALSYGGRDEIVRAARSAVQEESLISEKNFAEHLDTKNVPDPDLIIRTGGEMRLSNFLIWQSVYSELFFTKTLWPAFTKEEFTSILQEYGKRKRNFGT